MRLWNHNPDTLQLGRMVHKVRPRKTRVTFMVKATFRLVAGGVAEPLAPRDPELPEQIWLTLGPGKLEERPDLPSGDLTQGGAPPLGEIPADLNRYESDFAPFKPRADVLLAASAHAPGGQPVRKLEVGFRIGPVAKTLRVVGDYAFVDGRPTEVQPFTEMPLGYDRAYGGPGFPRNPAGRGHEAALDEQGREIRVMHNAQSPTETLDPLTEPAGVAPIPSAWPQRRDGKMGTYDQTWRKNTWPWFPDDFDWGHFNAAPLDQQVEGYLRGDEEMVFTNLHPDHPVLRCTLPGLRARLFFKDLVTLPADDEKPPMLAKAEPAAASAAPAPPTPVNFPPDQPSPDGSLAIPAPLDWNEALRPEREALDAAMKAKPPAFKIRRDPGRPFRWREVTLNLDTLFVDVEAGRVNLVWRGVVAMRTHKLRELDDVFILAEPLAEPARPKSHYLALLEAQKEAVAKSFDPPPGTPDPAQIYDTIKLKVDAGKRLLDKAKVLAEKEKARYAAFGEQVKARPLPEPPSKDYVPPGMPLPMPIPAKGPLPPPPAMPGPKSVHEALEGALAGMAATAPEKVAHIRAAMAFAASGLPFDQHPDVLAAQAKRTKAEKDLAEEKRKTEAKVAEAVRPLIGDAPLAGLAFQDRLSFLEAANAGRDLRRAKFLNVDLSGLDLSGLDLSGGSFLECDFSRSRLRQVKLGRASFLQGVFVGVDLEGAALDNISTLQCRFADTRFVRATIAGAIFAAHDFPGCDFTGVSGKAPMFVEAGLDGVSFAGARLDNGFFHGARVAGCDFTGAHMEKAHFAAAKGPGIIMRGAVIESFRAMEGADFTGGDFREIHAPRSNWEQARLGGADFSRAVLSDSVMTEIRAKKAVFDRALLPRVYFEEADLQDAVLTNANFWGSNFECADLTRADLSGSILYETWLLDTIFEYTVVRDTFRARSEIHFVEPARGDGRL